MAQSRTFPQHEHKSSTVNTSSSLNNLVNRGYDEQQMPLSTNHLRIRDKEIGLECMNDQEEQVWEMNTPSTSSSQSPPIFPPIESQQSHQKCPNLECPYKPGQCLILSNQDVTLQALIVRTYIGGDVNKFSNSCTVLLRIISSQPKQDIRQDLVLKIMDWRYSLNPRLYYECGPWNAQSQADLVNFPFKERVDLERWLLETMSTKTRNNKLIREISEVWPLPPQPTNLDYFGYLITATPSRLQSLFKEGLLTSSITTAQKEVFLRMKADVQLKLESTLAETVEKYVPDHMPRVIGEFKVLVFGSSHTKDLVAEQFPVHGLLMEQVIGKPVATLDDISLDDGQIRHIISRMVRFNLQLWRCGLQIVDGNLYNFILNHDSSHGVCHLQFVDYGALSIVDPSFGASMKVKVEYCGAIHHIRLPYEYFSTCFDTIVERNNIARLVRTFAHPDSIMCTEFAEHLPHCFDALVPYGHDNYIWHTIMLHILHGFDQASFHDQVGTALKLIDNARQIMIREHGKKSLTQWSQRVTQHIAEAIGIGVQAAMEKMKSLEAVFGLDNEYSEVELPLILLRKARTSTSDFLLFSDIWSSQPWSGHLHTCYPSPPSSDTEKEEIRTS